jgi:hypothetical protein
LRRAERSNEELLPLQNSPSEPRSQAISDQSRKAWSFPMMFYDGSVTCRLEVTYRLPTARTGWNCKLPYDFGWEFNSHPSSGNSTPRWGRSIRIRIGGSIPAPTQSVSSPPSSIEQVSALFLKCLVAALIEKDKDNLFKMARPLEKLLRL